MVASWERLFHTAPISIDDNFFIDLHGHSLIAGKTVTDLRSSLSTSQISVRDIYSFPTVRLLARHLEEAGVQFTGRDAPVGEWPPDVPPVTSAQPPLPRSRWLCATLQLVALIAFYGVVSAPVVFAVVTIAKVLGGEIDWIYATNIATAVGFALWPSWLLFSILLKWVVIGRYKAGRYPVWGMYYFRWWLVSRFQGLSWSEMFVGTPLMTLYYRAMGAKVGKNCCDRNASMHRIRSNRHWERYEHWR